MQQRYEQHIKERDSLITQLRGDIRERDEAIEKAIKVHRANERLSKDLNEKKALSERLQEELRTDRKRDQEQR